MRKIRYNFEQTFGISTELDWLEIKEKLMKTNPELFEKPNLINRLLRLLMR